MVGITSLTLSHRLHELVLDLEALQQSDQDTGVQSEKITFGEIQAIIVLLNNLISRLPKGF